MAQRKVMDSYESQRLIDAWRKIPTALVDDPDLSCTITSTVVMTDDNGKELDSFSFSNPAEARKAINDALRIINPNKAYEHPQNQKEPL